MIYRSFKRFKSIFFINLIGLSSGLACTLLIYLWVQDELSVDKFHEKKDRIFYVWEHRIRPMAFGRPEIRQLLWQRLSLRIWPAVYISGFAPAAVLKGKLTTSLGRTTKTVFLSIVIALPLSYLLSQYWLQSFAFKISLNIWYFLFAGLAAILNAWITVGYSSIKSSEAQSREMPERRMTSNSDF